MLSTKTYQLTATAIDPVHHGAGTAGNTAVLRTQEIVLPDGTPTVVPFVSGNSLRHRLRASAARHALVVMDVQPQSLPKAVVDLLFSGGALTKSGANADLDTPRRVAELFPALTLFGYSAGSSMVAGKLRVDNLHMVCAENGWRLPASVSDVPAARLRAGSFRGEEFGTRHDVARSADGARYTSLLEATETQPATTQMIYDFQVVKPGAVFWSALHVECATPAELAALAVAVREGTSEVEGGRVLTLGAKGAVGFGRTLAQFPQELLDVPTADYEGTLAGHGDEIVELLTALVA